jgi:hypothetical protein
VNVSAGRAVYKISEEREGLLREVTFRVLYIYEGPLKDRFERANRQFALTWFRKMRHARLGIASYPYFEIRRDLYAAAGDHGLFPEALGAYISLLNKRC